MRTQAQGAEAVRSGSIIAGRVLAALLAILVSGSVVRAQDLPLGRRLRVTLNDSSSFVGRADSAHDGRVWLAGRASAVDLGRAAHIDVSAGHKPKWLLGAAAGAAVGLAAGLLVRSIVEQGTASDDKLPAMVYLGSGAAGGLLVGTGLSVVLAGERWAAVPPDRWKRSNSELHAHAWRIALTVVH